MTTTDRRDADDATFAAEMDRLNRLEVADVATDVQEEAVTFVVNPALDSPITVMADDARLLLRINADGTVDGSVEDASEAAGIFVREIRRLIQQLPAPSTDTESDELSVENVVTCTHDGQPEHVWQPGERCPDAIPAGTWAVRRAAAVAGPQRDHGEGA